MSSFDRDGEIFNSDRIMRKIRSTMNRWLMAKLGIDDNADSCPPDPERASVLESKLSKMLRGNSDGVAYEMAGWLVYVNGHTPAGKVEAREMVPLASL